MNRRTSPGFTEWVFVTITVVVVIFLLFQLYNYAGQRQRYPVGLQIAGLDVGGMSEAEAIALITDRYRNSPVFVRHGDQVVQLDPAQAQFSLDIDGMTTRATFERNQQDFWAGFWGFLWGRAIDVTPVDILATHDPIALSDTLSVLAEQLDTTPEEPRSVSSDMRFQYGAAGLVTNIPASLDDVAAAFYRPSNREATLVLQAVDPDRPTIGLLNSLLTNTIQDFEARSGGVGSIYVLDLNSGLEVGYNAAVPMSGSSVLKLPIMVEAARVGGAAVSAETTTMINNTATEATNTDAHELLRFIGSSDDTRDGAQLVTQSMQMLGLNNSFLGCDFEAEDRNCTAYETAANTIINPLIAPDMYRQTTAQDVGLLLAMVYYCASGQGGTLLAVYDEGVFSAEKCQLLLDALAANEIGSLIEQGVPPSVPIAHRHGWQNDTYGDAGIVFSDGGAYVIVQFLHKPGSLSWTQASPLMADLSRGTYNFFNFDEPYLEQ